MTRTTSISLGQHLADFVEEQVRGGRYRSVDDVVVAGLELLEEQQAKATALEAALTAGEASGTPVPFDTAAFLADMRRRHGT